MSGWGWFVGGNLVYVGLAVGAAFLVALAIAVVRGGRRMRSLEERLARAERAEQVEQVEHRGARSSTLPVPVDAVAVEDEEALVPTPLGPDEDAEQLGSAGRVDREMFWDLLLRESVVRAAAVGHGVRAVLDARTRNRIRFEVRQEIKRARKQRKTDMKAAVRQLRQDRLEDVS